MSKVVAIVGAVVVFALVGCSTQNDPPPPADAASTVTIGVVNMVTGLPLPNSTVAVSRLLSETEWQAIGAPVTTGGDGVAVVTVPENATVKVGIWNEGDGLEANRVYSWQQPFTVPPQDVTLTYAFPVATPCPVTNLAVPPCGPDEPTAQPTDPSVPPLP